jgi:hypothetical protein
MTSRIDSLLEPDRRHRVAFAIGSGRCGTQFLQRVLALEPHVAAWHERHPLGDAFARYCKWNQLPVDEGGFLAEKVRGVREDLASRSISFEASAYLSLHARELHEALGAKIILLVRRPDRVVNSLARKGWYAEPVYRHDPGLAAGYQPGAKLGHHPFSRIVPRGPQAATWDARTVTGRIAWFWAEINRRALDDLASLPPDSGRVVPLESLDFDAYQSLAAFIGLEPTITRRAFEALVAERPNTLSPPRSARDWSPQEVCEFEREVEAVATRLGYPWRVRDLNKEPRNAGNPDPASPPVPPVAPDRPAAPAPSGPIRRLLRSFAR